MHKWFISKIKGKVQRRTVHEGPEGRRGITIFLTVAPDGVGGQRHAKAALFTYLLHGAEFLLRS